MHAVEGAKRCKGILGRDSTIHYLWAHVAAPNFLEARTRSMESHLASDLGSLLRGM